MKNKSKFGLCGLTFLYNAHRVSACATCFGAADADQTIGMNIAIGILLGVLGLIMLMFGSVAWGITRNQQAMVDEDEQVGNANHVDV